MTSCGEGGEEEPSVLGEESDLSTSCPSLRKLPLSLTPQGRILMPNSLVTKSAEGSCVEDPWWGGSHKIVMVVYDKIV